MTNALENTTGGEVLQNVFWWFFIRFRIAVYVKKEAYHIKYLISILKKGRVLERPASIPKVQIPIIIYHNLWILNADWLRAMFT